MLPSWLGAGPASSRNPQSIAFGCFTLDVERLVLAVRGEPLALPRKAIETLCVLVENAGTVVTKAELMDRLWPDGFVEESNLTQYVYLLRRAFKAHGVGDAIQTVPGRGYRFTQPLRPATATARRATAALYGAAALLLVCIIAVTTAALFAPRTGIDALSAQARENYLLGRYYWSLRTIPALHRSVAYFERVTRESPKSALGYSGLSDAYLGLYDYECDGAPCPRDGRLSQSYARQAVAANPNSAEAHTSFAMSLHVFTHDDPRADAEFRRAIALNPRYAAAHEWFGNSLLLRGHLNAARRELQIAALLDPIAPATFGWLARTEYFSHHYRAAIANAREALALDPSRNESRILLGLAYEQTGDRTSALAAFERLGNRRSTAALLAGVEARTGDPSGARALLAQSSGDDVDVALDLVALHRYASALTYLKRATFPTNINRRFLAMDPRLDPVRTDHRFSTWTN